MSDDAKSAGSEFQPKWNRWDDAEANKLTPLGRLVYRSNLLGEDLRITNTGGGNTSSKILETDPLTGEPVLVLWVKGSGGDLRTLKKDGFASLYMSKLNRLRDQYEEMPDRGPKSAAEDLMVAMYPHATFGLNPRAASIDTPLHGFIPAAHVDHTHPHSIIALAASRDGERLTRELFGAEVGWLDWQRPGFDLGLAIGDAIRKNPQLKGIVLGQHGLINWADDDKECYELTLSLIQRAAAFLEERTSHKAAFGGERHAPLSDEERAQVLDQVLPALRGLVSQEKRMVATVQGGPEVLEFVNSERAVPLAELGTSCPDHFLRTKIKPMYVPWVPSPDGGEGLLAALKEGLPAYREDYRRYYEQHRHADSPAMRDPNPTVVLVPGIGLIAFGKNKSESRVTAEFYTAAIAVMRYAESVSEYVGLPAQEAFDIEYWALEEAKLKRMPPEREFARRVIVVVGAGGGIGRAVALRVAAEGAHVVCADLTEEGARETANMLTERHGLGIGVAGTGVSGCGPAIGVAVDITKRESVADLFATAVAAYGGVDTVVVTAGVFVTPKPDGTVPDSGWATSFAVNVTGSFLVADEARRVWQAQGLPGALVLTTSANAVVAKKGSLAYDTSKAAANHLVRELAMELAPLVRVNGLAPATVVEGSSMFPRERVMTSLKKYGVAFEEQEDTEVLRGRLAEFYARRTLTGSPITLADQAEAAYLLVSDRLAKTTGQVLTVDGGLEAAFLR